MITTCHTPARHIPGRLDVARGDVDCETAGKMAERASRLARDIDSRTDECERYQRCDGTAGMMPGEAALLDSFRRNAAEMLIHTVREHVDPDVDPLPGVPRRDESAFATAH